MMRKNTKKTRTGRNPFILLPADAAAVFNAENFKSLPSACFCPDITKSALDMAKASLGLPEYIR